MMDKSREHLNDANETYFEHMSKALKISLQLFIGSLMAFIHALLPSVFTTSASRKIKKLHSLIENRDNK